VIFQEVLAQVTTLGRPYWLALHAEAYGTMGQSTAGLTVFVEALRVVLCQRTA
jgi:hypothetical protein